MPDVRFDLERTVARWRRALAAANHLGNEVLDELEDHLRSEIDELRRGTTALDDEELFLLASHRLGATNDLVKEYAKMNPTGRDSHRITSVTRLESLAIDLRLAWRQLGRRPAFTALAVLTLALGIGANTAIFSVVRGVLLRPLAFEEPERLVKIWPETSHSAERYERYAETTQAFEKLAIWTGWAMALTGEGEPETLIGASVSADFFILLRAAPALGRAFAADESEAGKDAVVVLSDRLWQRRFGADSKIVGRRILLDTVGYTVIGVMPPGMRYPRLDTEFWVPHRIDNATEDYSTPYLQLIGRLRSEATLQQARGELEALVEGIRERNSDLEPSYGRDASIVDLRDDLVGSFRQPLMLLFGAVAAVLLIASTNLASLLLGRAVERRREISMRAALGAERGRLVAQLLTESLLLAVLGGGLGIVLMMWSRRFLLALFPADMPRLDEVAIDAPVLVFALTVTAVTAFVCGLLPALQATRGDLVPALKDTGPGSRASVRLRGALVIAEIALALILVFGAGLLVKSFYLLRQVDPGFDGTDVVKLFLQPSDTVYEQGEKTVRLYDQILEEVDALPGVEASGISHLIPLGPSNWSGPVVIEGRDDPSREARPWSDFRVVSGGYFETLGIPLERGRAFDATDRLEAPRVVIVNEKMAGTYWPGRNPLGQRVKIQPWGDDHWHTVVGVVGDVKHLGLDVEPRPEAYVAYSQVPYPVAFFLTVKAHDATRLVPAIRELIHRLDPRIPLSRIEPMSALVERSIDGPRLWTALLTAFAVVALLLGAMGIYAVMAFWVGERTREIGIRLALGLDRWRVVRMVLRRAFALTAVGTVLGLMGAAALQRFVASMLFEVTVSDPWTLFAVAMTLFTAAVLACYLPAWRAARVEPVIALRHQ